MTAKPNAGDRAQADNVWASLRDDWRDPVGSLAQAFADARTEGAANVLRSVGRKLLAADYEGPDGGAPSEQGWPHFDCEDILGHFLVDNADALAEGQL